MIFYIVYTLAIVILILHFTGVLARRNMEWIVMVAAIALFAVNILDYLKII
jgi:NADH:ubiquinone oxidoreductase subunit K